MKTGLTGESTIEVTMLGGFSVRQNGHEISLGKNPTANALKMIEIIFLYNTQGITKEELLRDVFNGKNLSDKNNSFNNLLYQARHLLQDSGIDGEHFIENHRGEISLEQGMKVVTDVDTFHVLIKQAELSGDKEEQIRHYREAFQCYKGDLLPDFGTENWVLREREHLTALFAHCVRFLTDAAIEKQDYDDAAEIFRGAYEANPDSRWQAGRIRALAAKGDVAGASEAFREAAKVYVNDLEIPIPNLVREEEEKLLKEDRPGMPPQDSVLLRKSAKLASSGRRALMAPYQCPENCLGAVWQVLLRNVERRGRMLYIMMLRPDPSTMDPAEAENGGAEAMRKTLVDVLDTEDIYTSYPAGSYIVIPINVRREDSLRLLRRITERFRDFGGPDSVIRMRILRYEDLPEFLDTYGE